MEPRIQYATTTDDVSIAFSTLGQGTPLVYMPYLLQSHVQMEWEIPETRQWYERLIEKWRLIRYDGRGTGLSQRDVSDYSLDAWVLDLEAVVDRLGLERFALYAPSGSGPVAITYAARHHERVQHLILWAAFARASSRSVSPRDETLKMLMERDWELFTETYAHERMGWNAGEQARRQAAFMREAITPDTMRKVIEARDTSDVSDLLAQVKSPALILQPRQLKNPGVDVARELASGIPDASLALIEGASLQVSRCDTTAALAAIDEFLSRDGSTSAKPSGPEPGPFRTILFTDVEGSTSLTDRLGDAKARDVLRDHERIVREALASHGGAEVKTMGDGFMASFPSATRALECAVALQQAFAAHNASAQEPVRVRIGLNAGEPIAEEADLFGTAVIVAARIAAQASGGEILASEAVRQVVAGKGFLFADRGETALRGFEDPLRLYEVRWSEES